MSLLFGSDWAQSYMRLRTTWSAIQCPAKTILLPRAARCTLFACYCVCLHTHTCDCCITTVTEICFSEILHYLRQLQQARRQTKVGAPPSLPHQALVSSVQVRFLPLGSLPQETSGSHSLRYQCDTAITSVRVQTHAKASKECAVRCTRMLCRTQDGTP
jgi:hypothetical protein